MGANNKDEYDIKVSVETMHVCMNLDILELVLLEKTECRWNSSGKMKQNMPAFRIRESENHELCCI